MDVRTQRTISFIKKKKEFDFVFQHARKFVGKYTVVYAMLPTHNEENDPHVHIGIIVSKKTRTSVSRNKIKRRYRHILEELKNNLRPGSRAVLVARSSIEQTGFETLKEDLVRQLSESHTYYEGS